MAGREEESFFSDICVKECGGMCCDPWWGIISFKMVKEGPGRFERFAGELTRAIKDRALRITEGYVTSEDPPRPLFSTPEAYNVKVRNIKRTGGRMTLDLLAMFAFRCRFVDEEGSCTIHPTLTGKEVRPPHCGYMGTPGVSPGEKGYCRIIHAASSTAPGALKDAIGLERDSSRTHLAEGVSTPEEAARRVVEELKAYVDRELPRRAPAKGPKTPGRNDPCPCGSSKKYKKCHGR